MKFGIAAKLGVVLAVVGMLAAGITGLYAYSASKGLLVQSAKDELLTSTRVLARRITLVREEISLALRALARHPAAGAALEDADSPRAAALGSMFALLLEANPAYFQIRLIAADAYGRERVRVDRDGRAVVHVTGDDLQEKGHYPYVFETLRLAAGEVYISRVAINHERGSHAALRQPSVQYATPVVDAAGSVRGVIVINVDLNGVFALLAADLPPDFQLFLTNGSGDYLVHPDASRTFGFDKGRRIRAFSLRGHLQLRFVAGLRRWRRGNLRHAEEMLHIQQWLDAALAIAPQDLALATELLRCRRLVKGYSDTHARGSSRFDRLMQAAQLLRGREGAAAALASLREAALRDAEGKALHQRWSALQLPAAA